MTRRSGSSRFQAHQYFACHSVPRLVKIENSVSPLRTRRSVPHKENLRMFSGGDRVCSFSRIHQCCKLLISCPTPIYFEWKAHPSRSNSCKPMQLGLIAVTTGLIAVQSGLLKRNTIQVSLRKQDDVRK